jgi:hypothetical protein
MTVADGVVVEVLTNLWRAQRKLDAPGGENATRRQAVRHVQAAVDALAGAGWTVQDHDGRRFDPGLALEVIAFEPRPEIDAETVLETVRPCIYSGSRRVQIGQVIVARPDRGGRRRDKN